ncbi:MAG: hypothetical protein WB764_23535 [Xanthobacteraceae bacterium]
MDQKTIEEHGRAFRYIQHDDFVWTDPIKIQSVHHLDPFFAVGGPHMLDHVMALEGAVRGPTRISQARFVASRHDHKSAVACVRIVESHPTARKSRRGCFDVLLILMQGDTVARRLTGHRPPFERGHGLYDARRPAQEAMQRRHNALMSHQLLPQRIRLMT